jgi:hypothetical protein
MDSIAHVAGGIVDDESRKVVTVVYMCFARWRGHLNELRTLVAHVTQHDLVVGAEAGGRGGELAGGPGYCWRLAGARHH